MTAHVKSGDIAHNMKIELRPVSDCMPGKFTVAAFRKIGGGFESKKAPVPMKSTAKK